MHAGEGQGIYMQARGRAYAGEGHDIYMQARGMTYTCRRGA